MRLDMDTRIVKAIDEVKVMLNTYTFQRDTTRIKEILYLIEHYNNIQYNDIRKLYKELEYLGEKYYHDNSIKFKYDKTYLICASIQGIISSILEPTEEMICCMNYEIFDFFPSLFKENSI